MQNSIQKRTLIGELILLGSLGLVLTELRATGSRLWLVYGGIEARMLRYRNGKVFS